MKMVAKYSAFASLSYQVQVNVCNPIPLTASIEWSLNTGFPVSTSYILLFFEQQTVHIHNPGCHHRW